MKLISKLLCLSALLLGVASCDKDYELPPLNEPSFVLPDGASTITISEIRSQYAAATSSNAITITDDVYLKATVIGDDRSGNLFKSIILQDETGGISMGIDQSNYYTDYPVGQEVYVELKGLCVSVYGQEQQLGHPDGYLYRTPYEIFKQVVHKNGFAKPEEVEVNEFDNIANLSNDADGTKYTIVRLTGVHFEDGGHAPYSDSEATTSRNLIDAYGNAIVVRTSNYADFAAQTLPSGTGTVVGILGRYNGTWQLTIRTIDDVYGFDEESGEPSEEPTGGVKTLPYSESFSASLGDFTIDDKTKPSSLNYVWAYDSRYGAKATGYVSGTRYNVESWLVSPVIDLGTAEHPALKFQHAGNYFNGSEATDCTVKVITEDGAAHNLTISEYSASFAWVDAAIALSDFAGQKIQVAFVYKSTDSNAGTWEIKNFEVSDDASVTGGGGTTNPPTGGGTGAALPFSETFASNQGDFTIDNKTMPASLTYVWKWQSAQYGMKASAYVSGVYNVTESWLVSPEINLRGSSAPKLTFEHAINYLSGGNISELHTVMVKGENGTWGQATISGYPTGSNWTFVEATVDLSAWANQSVQIALVYKSTATVGTTWEVKNFKVQ
ncbi:MAG: choice-of-anchor J domain-containing protein [Alloprevotella sp.]|nr:choice-of-anchor J domain-containing protein [Alloprevotella sp.]